MAELSTFVVLKPKGAPHGDDEISGVARIAYTEDWGLILLDEREEAIAMYPPGCWEGVMLAEPVLPEGEPE